MDTFLTILKESSAEYVEKRSKFIATAFPCETEEQAVEILESVRTKYWDARHNCYAFVVQRGSISRFSDDGEPHGTAGKPILEVINGMGLVNVLVVVTRYFGGVLLGTGGLVKAYSTATRDALLSVAKVEMVPSTRFSVSCEYSDHGRMSRLLEDKNARLVSTDFTDKVTIVYDLKNEEIEDFNLSLTESFSGSLKAEKLCEMTAPFEV